MAVRLAVYTLLGFALRAFSVFDCRPLIKHNDFLFRTSSYHFKRRENTGRTGSDDYDIGIHICLLCPFIKTRLNFYSSGDLLFREFLKIHCPNPARTGLRRLSQKSLTDGYAVCGIFVLTDEKPLCCL